MNTSCKIMVATCSDDDAVFEVSGGSLKVIKTELNDIYTAVKQMAVGIAQSTKEIMLVEMSENEEGLPTAEIYQSGKITTKIFATYKMEV